MNTVLCVALCYVMVNNVAQGYWWSSGNYADAHANYREIMTHCEREGGECIEVNLGGSGATRVRRAAPVPKIPPPPKIKRKPTRQPKKPRPEAEEGPEYEVNEPRRAAKKKLPASSPGPKASQPSSIQTTTPNVRTRPPLTRAPPLPQPLQPMYPAQAYPHWAPLFLPGYRLPTTTTPPPPPPPTTVAHDWISYREAMDTLYRECTGGWEFDIGCGDWGNVCCYKDGGSNNY